MEKKVIEITLSEGDAIHYPIEVEDKANVKWHSDCFCLYYFDGAIHGGGWFLSSAEDEKKIIKNITIDSLEYSLEITIQR